MKTSYTIENVTLRKADNSPFWLIEISDKKGGLGGSSIALIDTELLSLERILDMKNKEIYHCPICDSKLKKN